MVYFISDGAGYVKIGSSNDVYRRIKALQSGNARSLKIVKIIEPDEDTWMSEVAPDVDIFFEKRLHKMLAEYNVKNEWLESSEWFREECMDKIIDLSNEEIEELIKKKMFSKVKVKDGMTKEEYCRNDYKAKYNELLQKYEALQKENWELQDKYYDLLSSRNSN